AAMTNEHERGVGGWQAEWETIPDLIRLAGGAARAVAEALQSLVVDEERMRSNLAAYGGTIFAESVATALAERIGRGAAHTIVRAAVLRAAAERRAFKDVLFADAAVTEHLSPAALDLAFDADRQLGASRLCARWATVGRCLRSRPPALPYGIQTMDHR